MFLTRFLGPCINTLGEKYDLKISTYKTQIKNWMEFVRQKKIR